MFLLRSDHLSTCFLLVFYFYLSNPCLGSFTNDKISLIQNCLFSSSKICLKDSCSSYKIYNYNIFRISGEQIGVETIQEDDIFNTKDIRPDDPRILKYIEKNNLINKPSTKGYNLNNPHVNPTRILPAFKAISKQKGGFFVDIGAYDGELASNTLELERNYGWTGLLIEAHPKTFRELMSKQRKSWASNTCVYKNLTPAKLVYLENGPHVGNSRVRGLDSVDAKSNLWVNMSITQPQYYKKLEKKVTCLPVESLLAAINVKKVDLFKVDTLSNEIEIIETIDLVKLQVKHLIVGYIGRPNNYTAKLKEFLASRGFKYHSKSKYQMYFFK